MKLPTAGAQSALAGACTACRQATGRSHSCPCAAPCMGCLEAPLKLHHSPLSAQRHCFQVSLHITRHPPSLLNLHPQNFQCATLSLCPCFPCTLALDVSMRTPLHVFSSLCAFLSLCLPSSTYHEEPCWHHIASQPAPRPEFSPPPTRPLCSPCIPFSLHAPCLLPLTAVALPAAKRKQLHVLSRSETRGLLPATQPAVAWNAPPWWCCCASVLRVLPTGLWVSMRWAEPRLGLQLRSRLQLYTGRCPCACGHIA